MTTPTASGNEEATVLQDRELLELAAKSKAKRERHGMAKTPEHVAWTSMKQRCANPKKREYQHYGGRGIKVCDRWQLFSAFYEDIGPRPSAAHSLDRIDVNGHYEPGNVRWATHQQQKENTRVVKLVTLRGKTQTVSAWEREMGLSRGQVKGRLNAGWNLAEAILTPSEPGQKLHMRAKRDYSQRSRDGHGRYAKEAA